MEIAIYAEHHSRSGEICRNEDLIERRSDDLVFFNGTPEEIAEAAELWQRPGGSRWQAEAAYSVLQEVEPCL